MPDRDKALDQLWTTSAKPIAEQIRAKYRHAVLPDFVGGAFGLLWQKLVDGKYDWRKGSFEGWWRTVLSNLATSAWRSTRVSVPLTQDHEPVTAADRASTVAALDQLTEQLAQLRQALNELAPREELRSHVNYFAVLLLELRRAVVARLRSGKLLPELGQLLPHWNGFSDSRVIETLLPWHQAEEQLAFRKDLAALGEIWGRLRDLVDQPPHDLAADHVCAHIVARDGNSITRDVWYNWKRHVKTKLGELGFPKKWDDLF
jgi:hypothetical protein